MGGAPIRVDRISSSPRATYRGRYGVHVDISEPMNMMARSMQAVSAPSLMAFLSTVGDEYFTEEIVDRFAYEGDNKSGNWQPLSDSTVRIREALGYPGSNPINERTQELLNFVAFNREYYGGSNWAMMSVPGSAKNTSVEAKLKTAQHGTTVNPLFPGAHTPPRPVLAVDESDMAALLTMLQVHIMQQIAGGFGSALLR